MNKLYGEELLQQLRPGFVTQLKESMSYSWKYIIKFLILHGIVPMLMGVYLMRSNNLLVRLCYPLDRGGSHDSIRDNVKAAELTLPQEASGKEKDQKTDSQYAPPGYFE